ncbi:ABC transporter permease [Leucobacter coleopterorum]|uniref:ABC transporter permease n=1 Tax=Leucobacter coleopterorum TaxID=2714933 RepID=UPI001FCB872A|nr:hypothetical protein [Leucobacter coleopterorum]
MATQKQHATPPRRVRNVAAARRRARLKEVWREFATHRSGVVGLVILTAVIALAVFAPVLFPAETLDVTKLSNAQNQPPGNGMLLGTDPSGRSVLAMLVWGGRASMLVGFAATLVSMVIGTAVGMAAGHFHGATQAILLRIVDFFLVVPSLVLAIVLSSVLGRGDNNHHRDRGDLVGVDRASREVTDAHGRVSRLH